MIGLRQSDDDETMGTAATSAATDKVAAFTVRFDDSFVRDLDDNRGKLGAILGFGVSRSDYIAHACRQVWGHVNASDDPASPSGRKRGKGSKK